MDNEVLNIIRMVITMLEDTSVPRETVLRILKSTVENPNTNEDNGPADNQVADPVTDTDNPAGNERDMDVVQGRVEDTGGSSFSPSGLNRRRRRR